MLSTNCSQYIALVHGTLESQLSVIFAMKCFSSAIFLCLLLALLLLASYDKVDAFSIGRRYKGKVLKERSAVNIIDF